MIMKAGLHSMDHSFTGFRFRSAKIKMRIKSPGQRVAVFFYGIFCLFIITGRVTEEAHIYVSRAVGDDKRSCELASPCKTISRAVIMASPGDHIHLDGANTDRNPYICENMTSQHPGIVINKSLLFKGYGLTPQIRCSNGTSLIFHGSIDNLEITLIGLFFNDTIVAFRDSSAIIDGCKFTGRQQRLEFAVAEKPYTRIRIWNSLFWRKTSGLSINVASTANGKQIQFLGVEVLNTTFRENYVSLEKEDGEAINIESIRQLRQLFNCELTLGNVTLSSNWFSWKGMVYVSLQNCHLNMSLSDIVVQGNNHSCSSGDCSEVNVNSHIVTTFISGVNFSAASRGRAFRMTGTSLSFQAYNSAFFGYGVVNGNGGALSLTASEFANVSILNSSFVNTNSTHAGGAIHLECSRSVVEIGKCLFKHNKAGSGGAVSIQGSNTLASLENVTQEGDQPTPVWNINPHLVMRISDLPLNSTNSNSYNGSGGAVATGQNPYLLTKKRKKKEKDYVVSVGNALTIEDSSFLNSFSFEYGGSIFIDGWLGYNVTIRNTNFINSSAHGPGGAISVIDSVVADSQRKFITIQSSRFVSGTTLAPGGAIFISLTMHRNITIRNTYFKGNTAQGPGGAMYMYLGNPNNPFANLTGFTIIESCSFVNNRATAPGGAIYISGGSIGQNVTIKDSYFANNNSSDRGGAVSLDNDLPGNLLRIYNATFTDNYAFAPGGGVFLLIYFEQVIMSKVTVKNCRSVHSVGGGMYLQSQNKSRIVFEKSVFLNNSSPNMPGGALLLSMPLDKLVDPGCIKEDSDKKFPHWRYNSETLFEDTEFHNNVARIGGAVLLENGKTLFRNCSFEDNFASAVGGSIYAEDGSTSVIIRDSLFLQSETEVKGDRKIFSKSSFIHSESGGPLVVKNATLNAKYNNAGNSLVTIGKGGRVDFGNKNLTVLYCPIGSEMQFLNFSNTITARTKDFSCKVRVTGLEYSCLPCPGGLYSLQRGQMHGTYLTPGFRCLSCPFGANCSKNIVALPNFWGFEVSKNPPTLKFTICPIGYCSPNEHEESLGYNGCQGNRFGVLCGRCKNGFTETLYSARCRPAGQCNDYWFWPFAVLYLLVMAMYLTFKPPVLSRIKGLILWFKAAELADTQLPDFDSGYLKIVFYFYQAGHLLRVSSSLTESVLKSYFIDFVMGLFNFQQKVTFSSGFICPFSGLNVLTKYLFSTFHVFGTLLMILLLYGFHFGLHKVRLVTSPHGDSYLAGVMQVLLLGYAVLGSVSFDLLRCVPVGSEWRLFYDGNVVCLQRWQYVCIAFVVTFVVPFAFVLFLGSIKLHKGTLSGKRFLLSCLFPSPFLIYWTFSAVFGSLNEGIAPSSLTESLQKVLYDPFKSPVDGKGGCLNWESVLIGRRLALIIVKAAISDPFSRVVLMTFLSFLFLLHHIAKQPFRDSKANALETISLLSLIVLGMVNLFPAVFVSLAVSSIGPFAGWLNVCSWIEALILGFVPAACLLFVVILVISQVCRLVCLVRHFLGLCLGIFRCICCWNHRSEGTPLLEPVA